jgi:hypothetical protein
MTYNLGTDEMSQQNQKALAHSSEMCQKSKPFSLKYGSYVQGGSNMTGTICV